MGVKWRRDYMLDDDGTLYRRLSNRPSGHGPWHHAENPRRWVVSIVRHPDGLEFYRGPLFTHARLNDALMMEFGRTQSSATDLGRLVPREVLEELDRTIANRVRRALREIRRDWRTLANEPSLAAVLVKKMNATFAESGWRVRIAPSVFATQEKEPDTGADIGWLVMVRVGSEQTTKALWMQAKKSLSVPDDPFMLKDLRAQFGQMRQWTRDAYALVFTPGDAYVFTDEVQTTLERVLLDAVRCQRGDKSADVIATTLESRYVAEIEVEAGPDAVLSSRVARE